MRILAYPLPILKDTEREESYPLPILKDTERMESYPLPAFGGTPPILRGERHAECISLCLLSIYPIGHTLDFLTEESNLALPLSELSPKS